MSIFIRVENKLINKLIKETIKEFTETSNKVSPRLIYLAKLAKHYKTFEEFENDYQLKNFHGIYWHLTTNPNFVINPKQSPTDLSSLAGGSRGEPGLMVSTDISNWHATFNGLRQYAAQIDLSDLIPNMDYRDVKRGFGHEIYVFKPEGVKVIKVLPISKALKQNYDDYRRNLPQNREQLKRLYDLAHQNDIKESIVDPSISLTISRMEEQIALQQIRRYLIGDKRIGKYLKKVRYKNVKYNTTTEEIGVDEIDYITTEGFSSHPYLIRITKVDGQIYISYPKIIFNTDKDTDSFYIPFDHFHKLKINENYEKPDLHISKEEEQRMLQYFKQRKNSQGERIGQYLKKIQHIVSNDPKQSDRIKYKNTDDASTYTIVKNKFDGELGWHAGYIAPISATDHKLGDDYESSWFDKIKENAPTGDWQGWGNITDLDKNRLKISLNGYIKQIRNDYHPHIAEPKAYLIKKSIDNFDVSDPRFAARPLSNLGMEDRLSISDFVDRADTAGNSSKVLDFLLNMSRQYIQPPRPPKPDIVLNKIADVVWPSGTRKSDVTIHGLDDMKPIIGFGYSGYSLTNNFIKQYSKTGAQLYIDLGADVRVVNMSEVMKIVQQALDNHNKSLTESNIQTNDINKISKLEESKVVNFIKNLEIEKKRVGKTLQKYFDSVVGNKHVIKYRSEQSTGPMIFEIIKESNGSINVFTGWGSLLKYFPVEDLTETTILNPKSYQPKKVEISREEESQAFQFLRNMVVDGERLGKTLRKFDVIKSDHPNTSDIIIFVGDVNGKEKIFRLYKGLRRGLEVRDASPDSDFGVFKISG